MATRRPPLSSPPRSALLLRSALPRHAARGLRIWATSLFALGLCAGWPTRAQAEDSTPGAAQPSEVTPKGKSEANAQASPTDHEQKALESAARRRDEAERAGQSGLTRRLAALSARWAKVLAALETAAKLETEAAQVEDERIRVQEETDRLITLVEQTEARRARALARLQALGLEPAGVSADPAASTTPPPEPAAAKPKGGAQ